MGKSIYLPLAASWQSSTLDNLFYQANLRVICSIDFRMWWVTYQSLGRLVMKLPIAQDQTSFQVLQLIQAGTRRSRSCRIRFKVLHQLQLILSIKCFNGIQVWDPQPQIAWNINSSPVASSLRETIPLLWYKDRWTRRPCTIKSSKVLPLSSTATRIAL